MGENIRAGVQPAEKGTAEADGAAERKMEPGQAGMPRSSWHLLRVSRRDRQVLGLVEIVAMLAVILALLAVILTLAGTPGRGPRS